MPVVVLDVRTGAGATLPGTIPPRPGGSITRGPDTFAVDERGLVWLHDQAKARVIVYEKGAFARAVPVPDAPPEARALLVSGGNLYLRSVDERGAIETEIDATTGRLLRRADTRQGDPSVYPFERVTFGLLPELTKGAPFALGHDASGNAYERVVGLQWSAGQCFSVIRRTASTGRVTAEACFDIGGVARDYFVGRDGAVFQLELLPDLSQPQRVAITRIIAPAP